MPDVYDKYCRHAPRVDESSSPASIRVGARFRRGRLHAGLSQRRVAELSGVPQSLISRFERGRAPNMAAKRVIWIAEAIGPRFPFGFCPHDHGCAWPYDPSLVKPLFALLAD